MKKKIILGFAVLAIVAVAAFNVNLSMGQKGDMSFLALANVEALAGCEDDPKSDWGKSTTLNCTNSQGESYSISACDFNSNYSAKCSGRPANT